MSYLIDTNVISELRKRERGHPGVVRWAASVDPQELHTSVLVIGEIRRGIELKRRADAQSWGGRPRLVDCTGGSSQLTFATGRYAAWRGARE